MMAKIKVSLNDFTNDKAISKIQHYFWSLSIKRDNAEINGELIKKIIKNSQEPKKIPPNPHLKSSWKHRVIYIRKETHEKGMIQVWKLNSWERLGASPKSKGFTEMKRWQMQQW